MPTAPIQRLLPRTIVPALAVCLFAIVAGLKWATVDRFGSPMPDWDQWDAEGAHLLAPWFENDAFWRHFFRPHNEHRVVMTKAQNLALTLLNGQWDARLEAVTNALLHAALATALWVWAVRWLGVAPASSRQSKDSRLEAGATPAGETPALLSAALFLLAILLFGAPLAWQNVLGGFHSQQYWLVGLSCAAVGLWPFARAWTARWWCGAVAGTLALLTMGSGFLAAAVVLLVVTWRVIARAATRRETWPTFALCAGLVATGLLTRTEFAPHASLKATTVHDFVLYVVRSLAWPWRNHDWLGAILWLPWAIVLWRIGRGEASRPALTLGALGAWVFVQLLATAYARGAGADYPASRYMDTLTFGAMVNAIALAWLARGVAARWARAGLGALAGAWVFTLGAGAYPLLVEENFGWEMPNTRAYYTQAEMRLLGYLVTNDINQLAFPDIPYPHGPSLAAHLSHPSLRALMPAVVRPSLPTRPAASAAAPPAFWENHASPLEIETAPRHGLSPPTPPLFSRPTWGSFGPRGVEETGTWSSAPVHAPLGGWLKFEVAGDLGATDAAVALTVHDAASGRELARVKPNRIPGASWRAAYVRAPDGPFTIRAADHSARHWLAFSAPVEVASLSYYAWRVSKHGLLIAEIAAAAALLLALAASLPWLRRPAAEFATLRRDAAATSRH